MNENAAIAAIATPPGQGGLAVIRISGAGVLDIAEKIFRPKNPNKNLKNERGYTAHYGTIVHAEQVVDEVIVTLFRAPHSFTGEDLLEISCHGGECVSGEVLRACLDAGAKMADAGEFSKRAFLNGKMDLMQAEAIVDLISSRSRQEAICAAKIVADKNSPINQIKKELIDLAAHLEAWIDYPEEDVPPPEEKNLRDTVRRNREKLDEILAQYSFFSQLRRGIRAVIIGQPNVGKSTLFNLLVGSERAIVTPFAGTTRDLLSEQITIEGYPLFLTDTAGLRPSEDPAEKEGIKRSKNELENSDLIIAVSEAKDGFDIEITEILNNSSNPKLCILNKSDLGLGQPEQIPNGLCDRLITVSASTQPTEAAEEIRSAIQQILHLREPSPDRMILSNQRQQRAVMDCRNLLHELELETAISITYDLTSIKLQSAISTLCVLTGENVENSIVNTVFSQFCVGK